MSYVNTARSSASSPAQRWRGWTAATTAALVRWLTELARTHERWRQRQDLRELDDHLLRDIGITRAQAKREASKPYWM